MDEGGQKSCDEGEQREVKVPLIVSVRKDGGWLSL